MELIILIAVVIAVFGFFIWKSSKPTASGSHPLDGATKNAVVEVLDVNKDGKVDIADAVEAVAKVKTKAKSAAKKVVEKTTKKAAAKKPAKPAPAKKTAPAKKPKK